MASKFHRKAVSRITPEARARMLKSLEIISQIHDILGKRSITQKQLASMLDISQPAVSKMLSPGGNLEMNTIVKLELLLGETILTTPQKAEVDIWKKVTRSNEYRCSLEYMEVTYVEAESTFGRINVNSN